MFTHQYLQHKANILKRAETEIKTLLDDITSPEIREKVRNWKVGDPITDEQPHIGQKSDKVGEAQTPAPEQTPGPGAAETNTELEGTETTAKPKAEHLGEVIHTDVATVMEAAKKLGIDTTDVEKKDGATTTEAEAHEVEKGSLVSETPLEDHGEAKTEDISVSGAPLEEKKEAVETNPAEVTGQPQEDAGAQLNHQPEEQPQQEPAGGNAPV